MNDLGFSGDGGPQVSEPLTIELIFDAVNDPPVVSGPTDLEAREDIPLVVPGLSVMDIDSDEPGGTIHFSSKIEFSVRGKRPGKTLPLETVDTNIRTIKQTLGFSFGMRLLSALTNNRDQDYLVSHTCH